jgi:hypothetical protein
MYSPSFLFFLINFYYYSIVAAIKGRGEKRRGSALLENNDQGAAMKVPSKRSSLFPSSLFLARRGSGVHITLALNL